MMDVALEVLIAQSVKRLSFTDGTQCGDCKSLGLTTRKNSAAMGTRENANITPDGADFRDLAAVGTDALIQDLSAHNFLVQIVKGILDFTFTLRETFAQCGEGFFFDLSFTILTLFAFKGFKSPNALVVRKFAYSGLNVVTGGDQRNDFLFLADLGNNRFLEGNELFDLFMTEEDRINILSSSIF